MKLGMWVGEYSSITHVSSGGGMCIPHVHITLIRCLCCIFYEYNEHASQELWNPSFPNVLIQRGKNLNFHQNTYQLQFLVSWYIIWAFAALTRTVLWNTDHQSLVSWFFLKYFNSDSNFNAKFVRESMYLRSLLIHFYPMLLNHALA